MMCMFKFILFSTILSLSIQKETTGTHKQIHVLSPTNKDVFCYHDDVNIKMPSIYCYNGKEKTVQNLWETVSISIDINNDQFEQFEGSSSEQVLENFKLHQSSWSVNLLPFSKRKLITLDPFNKTCIGILTTKNYHVRLIISDVDPIQLMKFVAGLVLFLYAGTLSSNQIFYYLCGITLGICGSVAILIYLISRIFPNKTMMYGFAVGGWTLSYYFVQYLLDNAKTIALQYMQYVLGYIAVSGVISFAICYRFGPLTNPRSKNLIRWSLQVAGLVLIFYSSYVWEVTYLIDLLLVCSPILRFSYIFLPFKFVLSPFSFIFSAFRFVKRKIFPPKVKLLTKKEYVEQGRKETQKALEELRGYCSSPECKPWKTVLKLKNPTKFAQFVEGSSHLSDEEIDEYDSLCIKPNGTIITDDSDSVAEYTEED